MIKQKAIWDNSARTMSMALNEEFKDGWTLASLINDPKTGCWLAVLSKSDILNEVQASLTKQLEELNKCA